MIRLNNFMYEKKTDIYMLFICYLCFCYCIYLFLCRCFNVVICDSNFLNLAYQHLNLKSGERNFWHIFVCSSEFSLYQWTAFNLSIFMLSSPHYLTNNFTTIFPRLLPFLLESFVFWERKEAENVLSRIIRALITKGGTFEIRYEKGILPFY